MTWKTHVIGGASAGIAAAYVAKGTFAESSLITASAVLGSMLPDIDKPGSRIARSDSLIGLVSYMTSLFTKHRGFFHTVFGALMFAGIFYALAMFRTDKESLLSFFLAFSVFVIVHAFGGVFSRLAGWLAAGAYVFGPTAAEILAGSGIEPRLNSRTAFLCSLGIFLGCVMHMVYDSFNPGGIMWAYPLSKKKFSFLSVKTNSMSEYGFFSVQVVILALIIAVCYQETAVFETLKKLLSELSSF